jgi:hypothetical protein
MLLTHGWRPFDKLRAGMGCILFRRFADLGRSIANLDLQNTAESNPESRQWQLQEPGGVEIGALPADGDVKMGACGAARASAETDFRAFLYRVAFFYFDF